MTSISGERYVDLKKGGSLFTLKNHSIVPVTFEEKKKDGKYFVLISKEFCQCELERIAACRLYETEKDAGLALIEYDELEILRIASDLGKQQLDRNSEKERVEIKVKQRNEDRKNRIEKIKADADYQIKELEREIKDITKEISDGMEYFDKRQKDDREEWTKKIETLTKEIKDLKKEYCDEEKPKKEIK